MLPECNIASTSILCLCSAQTPGQERSFSGCAPWRLTIWDIIINEWCMGYVLAKRKNPGKN